MRPLPVGAEVHVAPSGTSESRGSAVPLSRRADENETPSLHPWVFSRPPRRAWVALPSFVSLKADVKQHLSLAHAVQETQSCLLGGS